MQRQLNITIDIDSRKVTKYNDLIKVGDTVNLQLTLLTKGKKIEVTQETVQLFFKKEDNKKVQQFVMTSDNIIECTLDAQVTTKVGKVIGEVLFTASNVQVTSSSFIFNVEGSVNNEVLEESTDKIKTFDDINTTIKDVNETVEKYKNNIETIAGTSESVAALVEIKKCIEDSNKNLNDTILEGNILKDDIDTANIQAIKNIDTIGNVTKLIKDIDDLKQKEIELEGDITGTTTFNGTGTIKIETKVKDLTEDDIPNIKASKIMDIGTAATKNIGNKKDNIPILNEEGKLDEVILPESIMQKVNTLENKVLKNELTPIETDSVLTKLPNCIGEYVHNMHISGKTLQNVIQPVKELTLTKVSSGRTLDINLIKLNTDYSFALNLGSVVNGTNSIHLRISYKDNTTDYLKFSDIVNNISNSISIKKISFSKEIDNLKLEINVANPSDVSVKVNSLMCLEGEPKEIPSYFEGIKSVGEAEGNKISILTKGKNLFDINSRTYSSSGKIKNIINNTITLEQSADNKRMAFVAFYLKLKPNTSYSLSGKLLSDNTCLRIYNLDDDTSYCILESTGNVTFHTNNDTELQLLLYTAWTSNENKGKIATFETIQVEEGTTTTTYEPYKEDKTEILLPSPHMGIPSGVSDVIDYEKNERIKNIGKALFVGSDSENWSMRTDTNANKDSIMFINPLNVNSGDSVICNRFVNNNNLWNEETEGIQSTISQRDIRIRISKSKLETQDVAGFKKWLQANPTTVYYQLAEPKTEKLNIKDTLQSFENGYIMLDNAITPTAQLEYSTNIPSALGGLTQVTDKLVDDVTNVEITISDMDAEIGEARKGKTTLEERLEEDRTNILKTIGNVNVETDGDIASQLKNNKNNIEKAVQKLISINDANIDTIFENGIYRCYKPQSGFPAGYTKDSDFFLINYNTNDKDTKPWARQTLYDIRSNRVFIRSIRGGVISPWQELATVDDTDWIDLPLLNGATTTSDKALYRRIGKMVYFKGVVNNITTDNFIFGNLPIGFRPNSKSGGANIPVSLFLSGEDIPSRLSVYQNGNLLLAKKNDRNTCYLDGVMFVLD